MPEGVTRVRLSEHLRDTADPDDAPLLGEVLDPPPPNSSLLPLLVLRSLSRSFLSFASPSSTKFS